MKESLFIIQQCIERLTSGELSKAIVNSHQSSKIFLKSCMEELIAHFNFYGNGLVIPEGFVYLAIEAPKGETGICLFSDGSNKPFRCKIKSPGFLHLQGLHFMSQGHLLADVVTNIGTQDIVFGEVDR